MRQHASPQCSHGMSPRNVKQGRQKSPTKSRMMSTNAAALASALVLAFTFQRSAVLVTSLQLEGPPPGCQCTMQRCCGGETRCSYLSWLDESSVSRICEPFLNGTADANMGVCDAVLRYATTDGEASDSPDTNKHSTFHIFTDGRHTCNDLLLDADDCQAPHTHDGGIDHSVFSTKLYDGGRCALNSLEPQNGTVIVTSFGCRGGDEELIIYPDILSEKYSSVGICPPQDSELNFSQSHSNGVDRKRWMCHDVPARDGRMALMGFQPDQISAKITNVRFLFVSLGDFPCGMPLIGGEYYSSNAPLASPASSSSPSFYPTRTPAGLLLWVVVSLLMSLAALTITS